MTCVNDNGSISLIRDGAPSVRLFVKKYRPNISDEEDLTYVLCIVVGNADTTPLKSGTKSDMERELQSMARNIAAQVSRNPKGGISTIGFSVANAINASKGAATMLKRITTKAANIKIKASWVVAAAVALVILELICTHILPTTTNKSASYEPTSTLTTNIAPRSETEIANKAPPSTDAQPRQPSNSLSALGLNTN